MQNIKLFFLSFTILFSTSLFSQKIIKGIVLSEKNIPLEGASVYLNNTTIGVFSDSEGKFSLKTKSGVFELIISFIGYKKIQFPINTSEKNTLLKFKLTPKTNFIDEVVLKKTVYDNEWKYHLSLFKQEFIGNTNLSRNCIILNPKVLHFDFDKKKNVLTAFAREPLKIKHKGLGYLITYELEHFIRTKNSITYLGYSRYENLTGNKRKKERWKKNRLKTYNGSPVHFFKSVLNNTFDEEGFIVNQFRRVLNPDRPSEFEIEKARKLIHLNNKQTISFLKKIDNPKNALDSALVVLRKVKLPRFNDYLYRSKLKRNEIINFKNRSFYLSFKDNLSVIYTKEKEEYSYQLRLPYSKRTKSSNQTSSIIPLKKDALLDRTGALINPLDVFFEGYWSYEKFANTLPLNYQPEK